MKYRLIQYDNDDYPIIDIVIEDMFLSRHPHGLFIVLKKLLNSFLKEYDSINNIDTNKHTVINIENKWIEYSRS